MTDPIVPAATKLAAKRGFIRTMLQGYEGVLAAGITANGVLAIINGQIDLTVLIVTASVVVAAPPLAGLRSWVSITRKGIPEDYQNATLAKHSVLTPVEQTTDINHAVEVVSQ